MGFFEFLTKGDKPNNNKNKEQRSKAQGNSKSTQTTHQMGNIDVFRPKSFDDVAVIIDTLCDGMPAIVHLDEVSDNTSQRVIDLLSGAVYAINGNLCELEKDVYIFTPSGVKIK